MSDKVFFDSNMLIYLYSGTTPTQSTKIGQLLVKHDDIFISTQVLNELANVLRKKWQMSCEEIQQVLSEVVAGLDVSIVTYSTIQQALRLVSRYRYSYYDSLIIAAAIECGATILYTEDLKHNQKIDDKLSIVNPFLA